MKIFTDLGISFLGDILFLLNILCSCSISTWFFFLVNSTASWLWKRYERRKMLETMLTRLRTMRMYVLLLSVTLSVSWDRRKRVERRPSRKIS